MFFLLFLTGCSDDQIPSNERDAHQSVFGCLAAIEDLAEVAITDAIHLRYEDPTSNCPVLAFLNVYAQFKEVILSSSCPFITLLTLFFFQVASVYASHYPSLQPPRTMIDRVKASEAATQELLRRSDGAWFSHMTSFMTSPRIHELQRQAVASAVSEQGMSPVRWIKDH